MINQIIELCVLVTLGNTKHDGDKEEGRRPPQKSQNLRGKNIQDRLFYPETRAQQHEDLKTYFKDGEIYIFQNECKYMQIPSISQFSVFPLKPLVL